MKVALEGKALQKGLDLQLMMYLTKIVISTEE